MEVIEANIIEDIIHVDGHKLPNEYKPPSICDYIIDGLKIIIAIPLTTVYVVIKIPILLIELCVKGINYCLDIMGDFIENAVHNRN